MNYDICFPITYSCTARKLHLGWYHSLSHAETDCQTLAAKQSPIVSRREWEWKEASSGCVWSIYSACRAPCFTLPRREFPRTPTRHYHLNPPSANFSLVPQLYRITEACLYDASALKICLYNSVYTGTALAIFRCSPKFWSTSLPSALVFCPALAVQCVIPSCHFYPIPPLRHYFSFLSCFPSFSLNLVSSFLLLVFAPSFPLPFTNFCHFLLSRHVPSSSHFFPPPFSSSTSSCP